MKISRRDRNAFVRVGATGGKASAAALSPAERKAKASKAATARWAKAKEAKGK